MARNFKYEYKRHIHDTAPDMDRLWDKIEREIDKAEASDKTDTFEYGKKNIVGAKGGRLALAAAAAAAVVLGVRAFTDSTQPQSDDNPITSSSSYAAEYPDGDDEDYSSVTIEQTEIISYSELSLSQTDTAAYKSYQAAGNEYFVEQDVLEKTQYFADVTVISAQMGESSAQYILKVNSFYSKDGTQLSGEITIESRTPYILQENREYLIPLYSQGGSWYIVFENAPQIEITLDGGVVFQNGWDSLEESCCTVDKQELSPNDFYYDRMEYCSELDLQNLIDNWKNA